MALDASHLAFGVRGLRQPRRQALASTKLIYCMPWFCFLWEKRYSRCVRQAVLHSAMALERALHDVIQRLRNTKPSSAVLRTRRMYQPEPQLL